jgi:hypothetical protein
VFVLTTWAVAAGNSGGALEATGSVRDPSGAAIVDAKVTLRMVTSGDAVLESQTDVTGRFRFAGLSPGSYRLRVESPGFKPETVNLKLGAKAPDPVRIVLSLAALREEVTVDGGRMTLSANAGENRDTLQLDRAALDGLPILGNDVIGAVAALLDSGTLGAGGASMVVDGMETSEKGVTASAIQEVRINDNPYAAEYARPGKGRIEVITKPGTRAFHGDLNFLFRDSVFDARNTFAATRPDEQRRTLEGNLTGPAGRDGKSSFVISFSREEDDLQPVVFALTPAGELRSNFPKTQRQNEWNGKYTRQVAAGHSVAFRYEFTDESTLGQGVGGFNLPETAADSSDREHHVYFNYRGTLTSRAVNELSLRVGRHNSPTRSRNQVQPSIVVLDSFTGGGAQADLRSTENHGQWTDTTYYTRGSHLIKFGISVPDLSRRGTSDHSNRDGTFYFSSLADYSTGKPFTYTVQRGDGYMVFWQKEIGFFVQDDVKIRPNISLALGLRYDWQNYLGDHNNVSPRLAFAWAPGKARKTAIRGGAGIFYDRTGARPIADTLRFDGSHLRALILESPGFPAPLAAGQSLAAQPANLVSFAPGLREPYLIQHSAGIERQLSRSLAVTATYAGITGVKMFRTRDINAPAPPLYVARPDPAVGVWRQAASAGRQATRSLEIGIRGTITSFLKGTVQYTTGSAWNNTDGIGALPADSRDLSREWAHASFDMRNRLIFLGVLHPARLFEIGIHAELNGGTPYGVTTGRDDNRDGYATDRPAGTWRNSMRGPGASVLDLRWSRQIPLLKVRGKDAGPSAGIAIDAFNVLNHANYVKVVGNLSSPFFGEPVTARPGRSMQLTLQLKF